MPARKTGISAVCSRMSKRFLFLVNLLLCCLAAGPAEADLPWKLGDQWIVKATYLQLDNDWSQPVQWAFSVFEETEEGVIVQVQDAAGRQRALLSFDRSEGSLKEIRWQEVIRGKTLERTLRYPLSSPVMPLFTIIPCHWVLPGKGMGKQCFQSQAVMDGRTIRTEEICQDSEVVPIGELLEARADSMMGDWAFNGLTKTALEVSVWKGSTHLFTQYRLDTLPWPLLTVSDKMKAWLIEK